MDLVWDLSIGQVNSCFPGYFNQTHAGKIAQKPVSSDFSPKEATIIKEAKSKTALQFLAEIKQTRKASITQTERELLQQMAGLGLLDEVINIILLLTFNKVDSAISMRNMPWR